MIFCSIYKLVKYVDSWMHGFDFLPLLKSSVTIAYFQSRGMMPLMEAEKSILRHGEISTAKIFSNLASTSWDFDGSISLSKPAIPSQVISMLDISG